MTPGHGVVQAAGASEAKTWEGGSHEAGFLEEAAARLWLGWGRRGRWRRGLRLGGRAVGGSRVTPGGVERTGYPVDTPAQPGPHKPGELGPLLLLQEKSVASLATRCPHWPALWSSMLCFVSTVVVTVEVRTSLAVFAKCSVTEGLPRAS